MATREIIEYVCDPCKDRTGKDVLAELVSIDGVEYHVCDRDRRVLDAYLDFHEKYGQSAGRRRTRRAPAPAARRARNGSANVSAAAPTETSAPAEKSLCGLCRDQGVDKEVAKGSRAYHARAQHDLKVSEVTWL